MGKLGTAVADASIKFSVNYMNQVHAAGPLLMGWDGIRRILRTNLLQLSTLKPERKFLFFF